MHVDEGEYGESHEESSPYSQGSEMLGEVLDLVQRKGPISLREIMEQQSVYSEDDVYIALVGLEEEGKVEQTDGDLQTHGTTETIWDATGDD